jgi:uncharacterized glyoxalase superfamily protein PhnB
VPDVTPVLRYRDPRRAVEFLVDAFGFTRAHVYEGDDGGVEHAELASGDGMLMIGPERSDQYGDRAGNGWTYVVVEDADAHCSRARESGAEIVREPEDQDYGSREYTARDFEGNLWSFGTYRPELPA